MPHEEGCIRPVYKTGQQPAFFYDYFVKDHLGNVRLVLTEQSDFTMYAATMETERAPTENALFSNLDDTRTDKPAGYPDAESAGENKYVAKLNAKTGGKKIGPSLVIRVMAGDTVKIGARAFYKSTGPQQQSKTVPPVEDMVADLVQAFAGESASGGDHGTNTNNSATPFTSNFYSNDYQRLKDKDPDQNHPDKPKAYLNFVLFDDQFKLVEGNSGVKQVKATPDELQTLAQDDMPIAKSGFLYVYTSNESPQDVFFDDVILGVKAGPVLEETHYYPFGLTMAGVSSNALKGSFYPENKKKFNGNELQSKEFGDGGGLEWTDFNARTYDHQIGRFLQIDPWVEVGSQEILTPYQFSYNNPIRYNDPDGRCPICPAIPFVLPSIVEGLTALGAATGATYLITKGIQNLKNLDWNQLGAGASTTFVPQVTIPQSQMRNMQGDLNLQRDELNNQAKDLETKSNRLERSTRSLENNVKEHEQKLEDYKKAPDAHDNQGRLKNKTPEQREKAIEGRVKVLKEQITKNRGELEKAQTKLEQTKKQLQDVKQRIQNIDDKLK